MLLLKLRIMLAITVFNAGVTVLLLRHDDGPVPTTPAAAESSAKLLTVSAQPK
jgi:hypothetical protein